MEWEKPRFTVIDMNAEIGSYQPDFGDEPMRGIGQLDEMSRSEPTPGPPVTPVSE